ncbi:DNA polymerase alpha/epsilon subunit B-domain-containing protein [Dichotomocladium elegans]|nr:DNA polymerase alpha/epsilon subunit B-domain-containing protein [Dichotomocladium elegans]
MSTRSALSEIFSLNEKEHADVLAELESLSRLYNLSPSDMKFKWEAYSLRTHIPALPTVEHLRQWKSTLQREFDQKFQGSHQEKSKTRAVSGSSERNLGDYAMDVDDSDPLASFVATLYKQQQQRPSVPTSSPHIEKSQASVKFAQRATSNALEEQYNAHLSLRQTPGPENNQLIVDIVHSMDGGYRYMFEKLKDKSEALDDQIEYLGEQIERHYGLTEGFSNPTRPHQDNVTAVGRICCDASDGKMNIKSVVLETSRALGMGRRVLLDFNRINQYSLFPGQIIGVQGVNNTGKVFVVDNVLMPPLPPAIPHEMRVAHGKPVQTHPAAVVLAAGPYTLDTDMSYQPLDELIKTCTKEQPDVLILLGPFVPENHPSLVDGVVDLLPEDIFRNQIVPKLSELANRCPGIKLMLLPHAEDMIHEYPVFPQPPMSNGLTPQLDVQMLSNPSMIEINGVAFAVANNEILMRLAREELSSGYDSSSRLARLATHLLRQRSFYPLFPHAPGDAIDSEKLPYLQIPVKPDVLVLPSHLNKFVKVLPV